MKKRVITGAILVSVLAAFIGLRFVSLYFIDFFVLAASVLASYEISKCLSAKIEDKSIKLYNMLISILFPICVYGTFLALKLSGDLNFLWVALTCVLILFVIDRIIFDLIKKQKFSLGNVFMLIYPSFFFMFFYFINHITAFNLVQGTSLPLGNLPKILGLFGFLFVFIISSFTDIFAMLGGMLFKGPKLCPKISPKKTISGSVCGLVMGSLAAAVAFLLFNLNNSLNCVFGEAGFTVWAALGFGVLLSALNQIGDLFESAFKRKLQIKDSGTIFPGHGGIMDRLDGVSFVCVGVFLMLIIFFC